MIEQAAAIEQMRESDEARGAYGVVGLQPPISSHVAGAVAEIAGPSSGLSGGAPLSLWASRAAEDLFFADKVRVELDAAGDLGVGGFESFRARQFSFEIKYSREGHLCSVTAAANWSRICRIFRSCIR
jgi:hypothetical protein